MTQMFPSLCPSVRGGVPSCQRTVLRSLPDPKNASLASFLCHASALEAKSPSSTECGNFAGGFPALTRAVARHDIVRSRLTRIRGRAWLPCPNGERTGIGHPCCRRKGSLSSLRTCSVLSCASYNPTGTGALGVPACAAGSRKCPAVATTSASRSRDSLGPTSRAAASAGNGSELAEILPPARLAGSPSPDLDVLESAQETPQRRAQGGPVGRRTSSETEAGSAAGSADAAGIPIPAGFVAEYGGEQDASSGTAQGSTAKDLPSQPTKKASRGKRTKLPPVEDGSSSSNTEQNDEEPNKTRQPNNWEAQRNIFQCPSWDDFMSNIKAKPRETLLGQLELDGPLEGSANGVLQALSTLLGLPYETVAKHVKSNSRLQKHEQIERLIAILELYREYGLTTKQVRSLLSGVPKTSLAFIRDTATLSQTLDFLLNLGVTRSRLGAVVVGSLAPTLSMDGILLPKATFLSSLGAGSVGRLLEKAPTLLSLKLSRLQDNAQVLRAALGEEEWVRVVQTNPKVLTFPTEEMTTLIRIIHERYHLGPGVLATVLRRMTRFRKTTVDRMEATLDLLESVVGHECVVDVLTRQPLVLIRDTTTIQNLLIPMTPTTLRDVLLTNTSILKYNWTKSIEPALCYVVERCGVSYEEAVRARVHGPSLEENLKPRIEFLISKGIAFVPAEQGRERKGHPSTAYGSLSMVVRSTLKVFKTSFPEYRGR